MKHLRLLSIAILTLLTVSRAAAQSAQPPLIIIPFPNETLYQYRDGAVTPVDFCAPPDETRVLSIISVSSDGWQYAFLTEVPSDNSAANNIRVCDLENQQLVPVTGQPQTQVTHSMPAWSPDGTKLAFVRLFQDQDRMEFVIYDLATRTAQVVFQRDVEVSGGSLPPQVIWSQLGAIAFNTNVTDQTRPQFSEYIFYPQEFIAQDKPDEAVTGLLDNVYDSIQEIIRADGAYSFVVSTYGQPDRILDLATGQTSEMPGTLVKTNPLAPSDVFVQVMPMTTYNNEWVITSPVFSAALGIAAPSPESLAIAPDGEHFAFITYENYPYGGKVYVVTDMGQFSAALGVKSQAEGVQHLAEFDAHYGQPGALALYWGPTIISLRE